MSSYFRFSDRQEGALVPHVVRCCVEEVERRGMDEVGIYRISGTTSEISALRAAFNSSKEMIPFMNLRLCTNTQRLVA